MVEKTWNMHKRAFQALKRTFMHVSGLFHHILKKKLIYKAFSFIIKIWCGKTLNMHKRAFQALKRTIMHVSGLLPPYFDNKSKYFIN